MLGSARRIAGSGSKQGASEDGGCTSARSLFALPSYSCRWRRGACDGEHMGTGVVISQVYGGGGNSGATYTNDFVEFYNPTSAAVPLTGWSVQNAGDTLSTR